MPRLLLAAAPFAGHVTALLGLARALIGRGHAVLFYTGGKYEVRVIEAGCRFVPFR